MKQISNILDSLEVLNQNAEKQNDIIEKLICKYNEENQLILWINIYSFFTSYDT